MSVARCLVPGCERARAEKGLCKSHLSEQERTMPRPQPVPDLPEDDDGLVWEEPPTSRRTKNRALAESCASALRARPGEWARVATFDGKTSANGAAVAVRKIKDFADIEWRPVAFGEGSALYARAAS